jgi:hypothetical protein
LCVTSFSLERPRQARDSILPFNLPRSRSLTQTLAFLPFLPQPDPLHSPLPILSVSLARKSTGETPPPCIAARLPSHRSFPHRCARPRSP